MFNLKSICKVVFFSGAIIGLVLLSSNLSYGASCSNSLPTTQMASKAIATSGLKNVQVVKIVSATEVIFQVTNNTASADVEGIIIQDSIILRTEVIQPGQTYNFVIPISALASPYTLSLENQTSGQTTSYSVTQ